jgi:Family of unknown function (DUF6428)
MILSELIQYLSSAPKHKIEFLLPDGRTIPSHYHLTEVARVRKDFIDCGGGQRQLEYCTLQLWATFDLQHRLSTEKFLSILDKSNTILPNQQIEAEVEYEDKIISQYPIDSVQSSNGKLVVQLTTKHTDCLAKDACGVNPNTVKQPGCTPGTGCC